MQSKFAATLDCVLSRFGLRSRMQARKAIAEGWLTVNGRVVRRISVRLRDGAVPPAIRMRKTLAAERGTR